MKLTEKIGTFFHQVSNLLIKLDVDHPETNREEGGQDPFSKLMNKISG